MEIEKLIKKIRFKPESVEELELVKKMMTKRFNDLEINSLIRVGEEVYIIVNKTHDGNQYSYKLQNIYETKPNMVLNFDCFIKNYINLGVEVIGFTNVLKNDK